MTSTPAKQAAEASGSGATANIVFSPTTITASCHVPTLPAQRHPSTWQLAICKTTDPLSSYGVYSQYIWDVDYQLTVRIADIANAKPGSEAYIPGMYEVRVLTDSLQVIGCSDPVTIPGEFAYPAQPAMHAAASLMDGGPFTPRSLVQGGGQRDHVPMAEPPPKTVRF